MPTICWVCVWHCCIINLKRIYDFEKNFKLNNLGRTRQVIHKKGGRLIGNILVKMLYLCGSENAMDLKGNAQEVLKQLSRIIKHIKVVLNQFFNPLCRGSQYKFVAAFYNTRYSAAVSPSQMLKDGPGTDIAIGRTGNHTKYQQARATSSNGIYYLFGIQFCFLLIASSS